MNVGTADRSLAAAAQVEQAEVGWRMCSGPETALSHPAEQVPLGSSFLPRPRLEAAQIPAGVDEVLGASPSAGPREPATARFCPYTIRDTIAVCR